jgi:hypothetical protein
MYNDGCNAFELMDEHTETEAKTPVHAQCAFMRCGASVNPTPVKNPEQLGSVQSCVRQDHVAVGPDETAPAPPVTTLTPAARTVSPVPRVDPSDSKAATLAPSETQSASKTSDVPANLIDSKRASSQDGVSTARPTRVDGRTPVERALGAIRDLDDAVKGPELDTQITSGAICPGSARYGYDKLKLLGGCSPKARSAIADFEEFNITYNYVRVRKYIECSFTLKSPDHVFTLHVRSIDSSAARLLLARVVFL